MAGWKKNEVGEDRVLSKIINSLTCKHSLYTHIHTYIHTCMDKYDMIKMKGC